MFSIKAWSIEARCEVSAWHIYWYQSDKFTVVIHNTEPGHQTIKAQNAKILARG